MDLVEPKLKSGMKLNIELKNNIYSYSGMEKKIVEIVQKRELENAVVYSTFHAKSLEKLNKLDSRSELAILDSKVSDCLYKLRGGCCAVAIHPFWRGIDVSSEELEGFTVRALMNGHLYPEKPTGIKLDLMQLEQQGITDIILNEPEKYLG